MNWHRPFSTRLAGWKSAGRAARGRHRGHRCSRPSIEGLEDRLVLSRVSDGGTTTLSIALADNETFGIQSEGSTYDFTLGGSGTFTNGGVSNSGDFSGFGTSTLVLESAGISHYSTIDITDADVSVGATGTSVDLIDSGTNTYSTNIDVTMDQNPEPANVQIQTSTFTGSAGLDIQTTGGIQLLSGGITTASGNITMNAGTAGTMATGIADLIEAPITSTGGAISITGTGGTDVNNDDSGVLMENGGLVTTGGGSVTIHGTAGADQFSGQAGVFIYSTTTSPSGVTSATGNIQITGTGGASGGGVALAGGTTIDSTGTGTGAATITIDGTASAAYGVSYAGPNSTINSLDGNIAITGMAGAKSSSGDAGFVMSSLATISTTGTDVHAASISIQGTDTGPGNGVSMYNANAGGVSISSAGTGGISLTGTSDESYGVAISGGGTSLTSSDGNIAITGGTDSGSVGTYILGGVSISTTGTGAVPARSPSRVPTPAPATGWKSSTTEAPARRGSRLARPGSGPTPAASTSPARPTAGTRAYTSRAPTCR